MPHPPPCSDDEHQWGDQCFPKMQNFQILKTGQTYDFVIGGISPESLPNIARSAGDDAHIVVKKAGSFVDVTIGSLPRDDAHELLKELKPSTQAQLPD